MKGEKMKIRKCLVEDCFRACLDSGNYCFEHNYLTKKFGDY